jgi:hypothetical protein
VRRQERLPQGSLEGFPRPASGRGLKGAGMSDAPRPAAHGPLLDRWPSITHGHGREHQSADTEAQGRLKIRLGASAAPARRAWPCRQGGRIRPAPGLQRSRSHSAWPPAGPPATFAPGRSGRRLPAASSGRGNLPRPAAFCARRHLPTAVIPTAPQKTSLAYSANSNAQIEQARTTRARPPWEPRRSGARWGMGARWPPGIELGTKNRRESSAGLKRREITLPIPT